MSTDNTSAKARKRNLLRLNPQQVSLLFHFLLEANKFLADHQAIPASFNDANSDMGKI